MNRKDRNNIKSLAEKMSQLDEKSLVLIKNAVTVLHDRQKMDEQKKEVAKK